jgi:hypothetical protein
VSAPPTDVELNAIRKAGFDACFGTFTECEQAGDVALWTDGYTRGTQDGRASMLAAVVARLRERAAEHRRAHESAAAQGRVWTAEGQLEEGR